ncbi:MAG: ATP-grasp domain-containing protein [Treponema sp.]|jgi:acetyl-CoA carboxylase biotin carboxylase subunit|nr:ATP-grasp domain-containing protein [Treponema sp.]
MIDKLLIANRGEIAVRIIRTCREMGIKTVAVYSTADKGGLHTTMADESVCIGPPASKDSYLSRNNLIAAALKTTCGAIHPGVGFLSENADFARAVRQEGLVFIGPSPEVIEMLGDKVKARAAAVKFGLPVTPGTQDAVLDNALELVKGIGFPVIIKAAAGGGGKGMRIVRREADLEENIRIARSESLANFGDERVFIERFVERPRHVELQMLADGKGKVAVLGERDCSVQKNHQKLIEESPSPGVTDAMRDHMKTGAVSMFRELGYCGAGTIEFLVEDGAFYFMEVNARVQVEHPVSEFVSGVDIIRQQILACTESALEIDGADSGNRCGDCNVRLSGWAIECRINALSPGRVTKLSVPGGFGVRFDTFLSEGCFVPPYYDSMVGKLLVHAANRAQALAKMERALSELAIEGIRTNRTQQEYIIKEKTFRSGEFDTSYYGSIAKEVEHV